METRQRNEQKKIDKRVANKVLTRGVFVLFFQ